MTVSIRPYVFALIIGAFAICAGCKKQGSRNEGNAPLFDNIGSFERDVTTESNTAQRYFNQGLALMYGFNHAEAIRSFKEAARQDSTCAMAYWGAALSHGPNINAPMDVQNISEAYAMAQKALALTSRCTPEEQALIRAVAKRYSLDSTVARSSLDSSYAAAMKEAAEKFPHDDDIAALCAEALMDLTPWNYWTAEGKPQPNTPKILSLLEAVLARNPDHPGANHYYIHAVEASPEPEKGIASAERLIGLVPAAGHLVHMPAHVFIRVGRYNDAAFVNEAAADADKKYIEECKVQGFYPAAYYPHNIHFLSVVAAMEGRSEAALKAARQLVASVSPEQMRAYPMLEEYYTIPYATLLRFGRWEDMMAEKKPSAEFPLTLAMWHYSRGVAFAEMGGTDDARKELAALQIFAKNDSLAAVYYWSGTSAGQLLSIAVLALRAAIDAKEGRLADAEKGFREAAAIEDKLPYTEPPSWYFPNRHALGDVLLKAGRAKEAEEVYRDDLKRNRHNGWSLFGLEKSLRAQGKTKTADSAKFQFGRVWDHADVKLVSSRYCSGKAVTNDQ